MSVHYRRDDHLRDWHELDASYRVRAKLEAWARALLQKDAFQDSDSGYSGYIEIDLDGERLYAAATYESFFGGGEGDMVEFVFGTLAEVTAWGYHCQVGSAPRHDFLFKR